MENILHDDTICALATGGSMSAIAVIRISGNKSISILNSVFSKDINNARTHTIHFGTIFKDNKVIDEVLVSIFKGNTSYTVRHTTCGFVCLFPTTDYIPNYMKKEPYNKIYFMNKKYSFFIELKCFLIQHFMETKVWFDLLPIWIRCVCFFIPFILGFCIGAFLWN